jgi:NAD(P)-dependent dehydrogenase (short-subunit alcohol dehydrogenase family)
MTSTFESKEGIQMQGKTIVVTGGGSGIGRAAALLCAEQGARVGIVDINEENARTVAEEARRCGAPAAFAVRCDVRFDDQMRDSFAAIEKQLGPLYGLFANAGIGNGGGMLHELDITLWERIITTNLTGIYLACKYALQSMLAAGQGGSIVCTSSPTSFVAQAAGEVPAYSAAKGGVSALVRCLAIDYARYGIRVNAIVPGATETRLMWENVPENEVPEIRKTVQVEVPLARLAEPEEPARAAVWLLSEQASYITGSHLVCDGGILAKGSISV